MTDSMRRGAPAFVRTALAGLLALALSACATAAVYPLRPSRAALPPGSPLLSRSLPEGDVWLRYYLVSGQYDSALAMLAPRSRTRPRDELQRHLQLGLVLHYAGRFGASNDALEWAEREADLRYTKSISRGAASLLVNDGVLRYLPTSSEMAMIPYFRVKNYLALGDTAGALVEARKVGQLLAEQAGDADGDGDGCEGDGFLHYLAGMVYDFGRERADAAVALRQAERAFDRCAPHYGGSAPAGMGRDLFRAARAAGLGEVADSAAARYGLAPQVAERDATGDVVVLLEHGFVVHRTARELYVPIYHAEVDGLGRDDARGVGVVSAQVARRLSSGMTSAMMWGGEEWGGAPRWSYGGSDEIYLMKISWPGYRLESSRVASVRLFVDDSPAPVVAVENLSARMVRDYEEEQPLIVARAVARALTKFLVTRELEKAAEKKGGDIAGRFAFNLANLTGNLLEQADTRAWSLLPDEISVARLSLPPGEHELRLEALSSDGRVVGSLDLGRLEVRVGESHFLSRRVWGAEPGDWGSLARIHAPGQPVDSAALTIDAP